MQYIDEYRDKETVQTLVKAIAKNVTHPWRIMEICGGQTHSIARYRIEEMLPPSVMLLHGPGCPVCVTPVETIDRALEIASLPNVIMTSFGDMMRVPGSRDDLLKMKAKGGDIRILYSPLDAVELAQKQPQKEIVFFAVGFETTIPTYLTAIQQAMRLQLSNFSILASLFAVPPVIDALLSDPCNTIDGFLAAGHVCAVTGYENYHALAEKYSHPIVVTGFEPVDILYGIYKCVMQLEHHSWRVENAYPRAVSEQGNRHITTLMEEMLEPVDLQLRGIGVIPHSGLQLREKYERYDAGKKFPHQLFNKINDKTDMHLHCMAGEIMKGVKRPSDCPWFGRQCTPDQPVGAPMVSSEGVCSAYYTY